MKGLVSDFLRGNVKDLVRDLVRGFIEWKCGRLGERMMKGSVSILFCGCDIKNLLTILAVYGPRNWTTLAIYGARNK